MYTDNIKNINIIPHSMHVPQFKGHMKLELDGIREKIIIEHDNHMTDIFERILDAYGIWSNPRTTLQTILPMEHKGLGGIILTDKKIDDNAVMLPGGCEVTACAAYDILNNDSAYSQGSYNAPESLFDYDNLKMTYVYDWATNQGNGTIAAGALTNVICGQCGYGDQNYTGSHKSINISDITGESLFSPTGYTTIFANDEYIVYAVLDSNKITLYRVDNYSSAIYPLISFNQTEITKYWKPFITELNVSGIYKVAFKTCNDGENVYLILNVNIYNGSNITIYKLCDVASDNVTVEVITLPNNSGTTIYAYYGIEVYGEYIYFSNASNSLIEINMSSPAETNIYNLNATVFLNQIQNLQNGKLMLAKSDNTVMIFDIDKKNVYTSKCRLNGSPEWNLVNKSEFAIRTRNDGYLQRLKPNNYLATINNLDATVNKTADKTMKVTYTIQQV